MTNRTGRIGWFLLLILLLGGCSSTTFVYNRLNLLVPWYLGGYVDLDSEQRSAFDQLLAADLDWHRNEELPNYLQLLDSLVASLDEPATADSIALQVAAFEEAWYRLEGRVMTSMLELGEGLSDQQIQEVLARLEKDQQKYEKKYLRRDDQEYHRDMYENFVDSGQDFMGKMDKAQRAMIESATATMQRSDKVWLQERAAWLERLRQTLRREPGWQQQIIDDLARRDQAASAEYTEILEHNVAIIQQAVADLLNSRSEKQDRRLRKKLNNLREDVESLIAQGAKASS